ncbi:hypothetical protein J2S09_002316 [Bacillus fengqiuensis]|nr:hypothetical protein [Bacillus fengqiuensis]
MIKLTEPDVELVHRYVELLQSIEEGLKYVEVSFDDYGKTEGDLVLGDVLDALAQVQSANAQLQVIFAEEHSIVETIQQYGAVVNQCFKLEGKMELPHEKQEVVKQSIIPAFLAWKQSMESNLKSYIIQ